MPIFNDHPYTSITIKIDQLSKPHHNDEVDNTLELYVSDLLQLIRIQPTSGPSEAARAIRKRIKYGDDVEEQIRALNILELLILNSGAKIGPVIARDDKLLDVLKGVINGSGKTGSGVNFDTKVQVRAKQLAIGWKSELADLDGYKYLASLWKNIPRHHKSSHRRSGSALESPSSTSRSRLSANDIDDDQPYNAFAEAEAIRSPSPSSPAMNRHHNHRGTGPPGRPTSPKPTSTSKFTFKKDRKHKHDKSKRKKRSNHGIVYADEQFKIPQINYKVEAPKIRTTIAECHTHTTSLNNLLISLPSNISPLDDDKIGQEFDKCKSIRRKVLKYLQFVGVGDTQEKSQEVVLMDEEFLGSLIVANEQLVEVFKKYDYLAGYSVDNPAPNYDDESSEESYYTSDEEDEPSVYDDDVDSVTNDVNHLRIHDVGSSSHPTPKSPPPPRPAKPPALVSPHTTLQRTNTNATSSSDPFGDGNELGASKSIYS